MKSRWVMILCLVLICFTAFCAISIVTRIFTFEGLQMSFMGALLGTVITSVVTVLLLSGQTSAAEIKERNVKVFEKKSEIFQKYIDIVWEVWDDHTVSGEEYLKLTELYYKTLMLYLNKKSLEIIGENLSKIGDLIGDENQTDNNKTDDLQDYLIAIINVLSDEISLGGHIDLSKIKVLVKDLDQKRDDVRKRGQRTTFKMLKIKTGTELVCKNDEAIKCITIDENNGVKYKEKEYTISGLAVELNNGKPINGFDYFMLNGKTLWETRKKIEK